MYDPQIEFADPLVPSELTFGVAERVRADGTILREPDAKEVEALAAQSQSKGRGVRRDLLSQQLRQSGQRARRRQAARGAAAGSLLHPVVGGGAANPRIPARLDRRRQRLRHADLAALSAAPERAPQARELSELAADHAVVGRRRRRGDRRPQSGAHDRERPRGRRARRLPLRRGARHPAADVVRHGRHHGQGLPDRGRRAADHRAVRSRPAMALQGGQRPARHDSVDRHDRDRRRRRQHRAGRQRLACSRSAPTAPAPRPVRPATAAAARRRRSPTPISCWACSTPTTSWAAT